MALKTINSIDDNPVIYKLKTFAWRWVYGVGSDR